MEIDFDRMSTELAPRGKAELITADSRRAAEVPERWHGVLTGRTAAERREAALSHWDSGFLDMIPQFAGVLRERLVDVRVFWVDYSTVRAVVLVYVVEHDEEGYACWVGWDPASCGDSPRFWDTLPEPVQQFLRHTHAGFVDPGGESYGLMRPSDFETFAEHVDWPEGVPRWMDDYVEGQDLVHPGPDYRRIESTRLVVLTKRPPHIHYCTSPDLAVGEVSLVYSSDSDVSRPTDLGTELDKLMMSRLHG